MKLAKILLVEDYEPDADFFLDFFAKQRIRNTVTRVVSYDEAWSHAQAGTVFDLLVVDVRVPSNGGLEFIERIKKLAGYSEAKIVVTSGSESVADVEKARKIGVQSYIVKPISSEKWWPTVNLLGLDIGLLMAEAA